MADTGTRWTTVAEVIRERRSNLNVDLERAIPRDIVDDLVNLAVVAPNHYRTNPCRFVVVTGSARARLGNIAATASAAKPDAQDSVVERQRVQFLRAPTVLAVAAAPDEDPIKHFENKYTVAAAVEHILLGATAAGLASAWRSGPAMVDPAVSTPVKEALGLDTGDEIIGFIYLGYPIGPPGSRETPSPRVTYLEA